MKISFFVDGLYDSGGMKIIFEYANRFTARGNDVILYYPLIPYNYFLNQFRPIKYLGSIKSKIGFFLKHKKKFKEKYTNNFTIKAVPLICDRFIRDGDVAIATRWPTAFSVNKLSVSRGKKIYFIQGYEKWDANIEKVNESYTLKLKGITISSFLRELLYDKFSLKSDVILNGINIHQNNIINKKNNSVPIITFIDYEPDNKGTPISIEVVSQIKNKYPEIKFKAFGYKRFHKLPDFVEFIENPDLNTIKKIYSETDIFLFTSFEEGFGLPPAEAMAFKCAVITTKVGAVVDYSKNNYSAIHVNIGNVGEIIQKVIELIENEEIKISIANKGYETVREILDWDKSIQKFENIISE
jgi:glycosyltransferase involved in cell wall biosynthesis